MTPYTLALFFHVAGAIGFFVGIGAQVYCLAAMRRARSVEQVRALADPIARASRLVPGAVLVLLAAGIYMAATEWGFATGWIAIAIGALVAVALTSQFVIEPRRNAIVALANEAPDGPIPPDLAARIHRPVLGASARASVAVLIGIVFLMTTKPPLGVSLLVIVVALAVGLVSGLPLWLAARAHAPSERMPSQRSRR